MKRVIAILILLLFTYNTFGFLAIHPFLSMYYKNLGMQKTERHSEEDIVELLVFKKADIEKNIIDFRWIHSLEFKYNGNMYDVVKKKENGEKLFLYCINDKKEKELEKDFEKRLHDNSAGNKHQQKTSNHLNILLSEAAQFNQLKFNLFAECKFIAHITNFYDSIQSEILSPPPQLV